ncbi:MAG: ATPase domain-containing protein [Candidatus Altiarchaeota archaeon]
MAEIERIPTGIHGLDELIEGGIPAGSSLLVAGGPGTGKTIAVTQMAYNFLKQGKIVVLMSLESDTEKIYGRGDMFGWNLRDYAEKRQLMVATPREEIVDINNTAEDIISMGKMKHDKGVVIILDSITKFLEIGVRKEKSQEKKAGQEVEVVKSMRDLHRQDIWRLMLKLEKAFKGTNTTLILVGEAEDGGPRITVDGVAEYECDGVMILRKNVVGDAVNRFIEVAKLRETKIESGMVPFEFTKNGIKVGQSENTNS